MTKEEWRNIMRPYLDKVRAATEKANALERDPAYLAHLESIKAANGEVNNAYAEFERVNWSLPRPDKSAEIA